MKFIHEIRLNLISFLIIFIALSCNESKALNPFKTYKSFDVILESGEKIKTYIAHTPDQQRLGLSLAQPNEFSDSDAMLFTGESYTTRQFWMPETFFDLDLFFLGPDMTVLDIHRKLKHHTKREPRSDVPMSKVSYCQHVLEMKASSELSAKIKVGMKLKTSSTLQKIIPSIR